MAMWSNLCPKASGIKLDGSQARVTFESCVYGTAWRLGMRIENQLQTKTAHSIDIVCLCVSSLINAFNLVTGALKNIMPRKRGSELGLGIKDQDTYAK